MKKYRIYVEVSAEPRRTLKGMASAVKEALVKLDIFKEVDNVKVTDLIPSEASGGWITIDPPGIQHRIMPSANGELLIVSSRNLTSHQNGRNSITIKPSE